MLLYRGEQYVIGKKFNLNEGTYKLIKRNGTDLVFESVENKKTLKLTEEEFNKSVSMLNEKINQENKEINAKIAKALRNREYAREIEPELNKYGISMKIDDNNDEVPVTLTGKNGETLYKQKSYWTDNKVVVHGSSNYKDTDSTENSHNAPLPRTRRFLSNRRGDMTPVRQADSKIDYLNYLSKKKYPADAREMWSLRHDVDDELSGRNVLPNYPETDAIANYKFLKDRYNSDKEFYDNEVKEYKAKTKELKHMLDRSKSSKEKSKKELNDLLKSKGVTPRKK